MRYPLVLLSLFLVSANLGCREIEETVIVPRAGEPHGFSRQLSAAALQRTKHMVRYDPAYRKIPYPNGDVPADTGVCTDVVIRSYRVLGIDLQQDMHEEITRHFAAFPNRQRWGLTKPDPNIDHRRVPNLQVLFARRGQTLPVTEDPADYLPGDLVTWSVEGRPHIGIMVNRRRSGSDRYMVVHNIGLGPELEDMLFRYPITGHYRYYGPYGEKRS